ncbi:MAG: hypothetical protein JRG82_12375 [Deltaproteobacteria bacterium]|nr:hypothetical protein [Deltaproteobacteria bacterium]
MINRTEDQQILNVLVRQRYDETFGMLAVASVTANMRFSARTGTEIGIGPSEDYEGNLVPFSAGLSYEENPTISYVPLTGEKFTRMMLSPISLEEWHLLAAAAKHPGQVMAVAVRRVNGLRNPLPGEAPSSPDFARFVELYDQLRRASVLDVVQASEAESEDGAFWAVHDYEGAHGDSVREMFDLLGLEVEANGSTIVLPIRAAIGSSGSAVHVEGRSAFDVLQAFGVGIEIPAAHSDAGVVAPLTWPVSERERIITIRSSKEAPSDSTVQIGFRDRWFYIDATDTNSKRAFGWLRTLIGLRLSTAGVSQQAPVLTVPVN